MSQSRPRTLRGIVSMFHLLSYLLYGIRSTTYFMLTLPIIRPIFFFQCSITVPLLRPNSAMVTPHPEPRTLRGVETHVAITTPHPARCPEHTAPNPPYAFRIIEHVAPRTPQVATSLRPNFVLPVSTPQVARDYPHLAIYPPFYPLCRTQYPAGCDLIKKKKKKEKKGASPHLLME